MRFVKNTRKISKQRTKDIEEYQKLADAWDNVILRQGAERAGLRAANSTDIQICCLLPQCCGLLSNTAVHGMVFRGRTVAMR